MNNSKGMSIAGLVLGIIACVFAWFGYGAIFALVCGIVGIVLSVKGRKAAIQMGEPSGLGTAGMVLSIIGIVLSGIGFACTMCALAAVGVAGNLASTLASELASTASDMASNLASAVSTVSVG